MSIYQDVIKQAFIFFPLVAILITLPYIAYNYYKYGSIISLRIAIIYSFVLYLLCTYFLVILPLPSIEDVQALTTPRAQLIPFTFISDIIKDSKIILDKPSTYLSFLHNNSFLQVIFNLFMTVPFGMYLRYYFKCDLKKTIILTFGLSLFFELTQLSGLYFIYPRSYRLFDVDDLIVNTSGGVLGYFIVIPFLKILPTRKKLDDISFERGHHISFSRRLYGITVDLMCVCILFLIINRVLHSFNLPDLQHVFLATLLLYFTFLPILWRGKTIGKYCNKTKVVSTSSETTKWYQYAIRYLSLFIMFILIFSIPDNFLSLMFFVFFSLYIVIIMIKKKTLFYEKLSKTKNISTIKE